MGVINNLIEIRRKFRAIVGANWDGTPLEYLVLKNKVYFTLQPMNTSGTFVNFSLNIYGFDAQLERKKEDGTWVRVNDAYTSSRAISQYPLADITTTSICRIAIRPFGNNADITAVYSNEFTVTRTEAQTASATPKSKGADIFTESEVDSIDVVKENIEKE